MPTVIIHGPEGEAAPPINVNGCLYPFAFGAETSLPDEAIEALRNSSRKFTIVSGEAPTETDSPAPASPEGSGDAGAVSTPGGNDGASDSSDDGFDPESVIIGTVGMVEERLANLTRDQLLAVKAAEEDREAPRVGVGNAITKALAAFDPE